jgi:hypothetical protein
MDHTAATCDYQLQKRTPSPLVCIQLFVGFDRRERFTMPKDIDHNFTYHPPKEGQPERYAKIRAKAKELAELIDAECPQSRERSIAMTELETSVFWANAAIARNE